jgi:xanthine/uracil permease
MNAVLSLLISAGIIAFGLWTIVCSITTGAPIGFTLLGVLPVAIGSVSLYGAIGEARLAQNIARN